VGPLVQAEEHGGDEHQVLAIAHEGSVVIVHERAGEEEAEHAGKLDGGVRLLDQEAIGDGRAEERDEDGVAVELAAEPYDEGHGYVEHHLDLDGPEGAVHGGDGVVLEDAGDAGGVEVGEGEIADEELADVEAAVAEGDDEAEDGGKPVAGEDAGGALHRVVAEGGGALVAREDQEAGDGEEAFDGEAAGEHLGKDLQGRLRAEVMGVEEHDRFREQEADDVEVIVAFDGRRVG
jgi:hypothetical protein